MRVAVITTVAPERCGNRTYGEEIARQAKGVEVTLIGRPFDGATILARTEGFDVVHIILGIGLLGDLTAAHINTMKARGQKTVFTFHEYPWNLGSEFIESFDAVLVHQKQFIEGGWGWGARYHYVPHGIPINEELPPYTGARSDFIGIFGFPVPFKQYTLSARLARAVGKKIYGIMPGGSYGDIGAAINEIQSNCPGSEIDTDFPPHDEALRRLSQCAFMLFPYHHTAAGIGGSARAGVGARRPVVISKVVRFQDWLDDYSDEFYIIPDPYTSFEVALPLVQQVMRDIESGTAKIPTRAFNDQNWKTVGAQLVTLYNQLVQ